MWTRLAFGIALGSGIALIVLATRRGGAPPSGSEPLESVRAVEPAPSTSESPTAELEGSRGPSSFEGRSLVATGGESDEGQEGLIDAEGTEILVHCVDMGGEPVIGCKVEALAVGSRELMKRVVTGPEGEASLSLPQEVSRVMLRADEAGRSSSGDRVIDIRHSHPARESDGAIRLVLHPRVDLRGLVRFSDGEPAVGAEVSIRPRGLSLGGGSAAPVGPLLTDELGAFRAQVDGVPCSIVVSALLGAQRASEVVVALPGGAAEVVQLEIVRSSGDGFEIRGSVRLSAPCNLSEASVAVVPVLRPADVKELRASHDGSFSFEVEGPGEFKIAARSGSCATSEPLVVALDSNQPTAYVVLELDPGARIAGRVLRDTGEPLVGIPIGGFPTVSESGDGWLLEPAFASFRQLQLSETDSEGAFNLGGLRQGYLYQVVCIPDQSRPQCWVREYPVRAGTENLAIVIDEARIRGGVLSGLARSNGAAASALTLLLYERFPNGSWNGRLEETKLDQGEFRVEGLVVGNDYFVEAHVAGAGALTRGPWTAAEEEFRIELEFGQDGGLSARLVPMDGRPVEDWTVAVVERGEGPRRPWPATPRAADGLVHFAPLAAGRYSVSAQRGSEVVGPLEIEIQPGRTTQLDLQVGR